MARLRIGRVPFRPRSLPRMESLVIPVVCPNQGQFVGDVLIEDNDFDGRLIGVDPPTDCTPAAAGPSIRNVQIVRRGATIRHIPEDAAISCRPYVPSSRATKSNSNHKTRATRDPSRNKNGLLFGQLPTSILSIALSGANAMLAPRNVIPAATTAVSVGVRSQFGMSFNRVRQET